MNLLRPFRKQDVITRSSIIEYYRAAANPQQLQVALEESHAYSLYQSALQLLNKGDLHQAITLFGQALNEKNVFDSPQARRLLLHKLYQVEGVIEQQKKKTKETKKDKAQLEKLALEYIEMGDQCLDEYDDPTSALNNYDKALALNPLHPTALARKGFALRSLGRIKEAHKLLKEGRIRKPIR